MDNRDPNVLLAVREAELKAWDEKNSERLAAAKFAYEAAEKLAEKARDALYAARQAAVVQSRLAVFDGKKGRMWTDKTRAVLEREVGWKLDEQDTLDGRPGQDDLMHRYLLTVERRIEENDPEVKRWFAEWNRLHDRENQAQEKLRIVERERQHISGSIRDLQYDIKVRDEARQKRDQKKAITETLDKDREMKRSAARNKIHEMIKALDDPKNSAIPAWVAELKGGR